MEGSVKPEQSRAPPVDTNMEHSHAEYQHADSCSCPSPLPRSLLAPLLPLEFVSINIRGEMQREFEITVEQSGSRCALASKLISNWPTERRSTQRTEAEISVESPSLTPAKPSREVRASDPPAVE